MYIAYPRIARTFALTKKEKMEKRIKTVWILTIITAILIIGGQGYWLHHQYCYSTKTFMQELHKQILQLEKEEMNTRYDKRTNNHKYTLSYKIEMPDSVNQNGKTTCIIEGGNLAASKIRNLECPSYEICLIDYGCGKFNRKIHIMEQYP